MVMSGCILQRGKIFSVARVNKKKKVDFVNPIIVNTRTTYVL
jgi:hypothetical protein